MRYRRTKIILPKKGQPLDVKDMIQRQVNWEEASEPSFIPQTPRYEAPRASQGHSVGWLNFYKGIIKFSMEFRP